MTDRDAPSHAGYNEIDLLTPCELAWEFLRRNKNYCREFGESKSLNVSELESRARHWRLQKPS